MRRPAALAVLLAAPLALLAACGESAPPGGVTADEAAALNEAAEMLDENSVSVEAIGG